MSETTALLAYKLCCTEIPDIFLVDKTVAKQYFRQFGRVKRLIFRPKQRACTVEFVDYKSYLNALDNGGEFDGQLFNVFPNDSPKKQRKKSPKQEKNAKKEKKDSASKSDPDWDADPDVRAELEAMGAIYRKDYNLRPAKMDVDPLEIKEKKLSPRQSWRKPPAAPSKDKSSFTAEHMDLIGQIRQRAMTFEEKYRVLDARDKLIRLKLKKSGKMKSGPTIGTCPDMCPEKERLMREAQHQVAMYEQWSKSDADKGATTGLMNPSIAVKQYSRSSADQESPLPHDLRPAPVLQMTMHYLIHEIMDLAEAPDTNLAEWYHFLWDRTRGIRKDITQQELTSGGSVQLVEQCARFHIYCSARLVAEDASVFDQKINSENLTKCLQSLKYMYHDLALRGKQCRHEPEFRAYVILLNLNNSAFMADLQKLPARVQKSPEVHFALQIHSALDKNNFVRFFKLVRSTTFLNSCILLRYFVQIRLRALKSLIKCYRPSSARGQATFPVSELVKLLAFEDAESAIDFFRFYGLNCTTSGFTGSTSTTSGFTKSDTGAPSKTPGTIFGVSEPFSSTSGFTGTTNFTGNATETSNNNPNAISGAFGAFSSSSGLTESPSITSGFTGNATGTFGTTSAFTGSSNITSETDNYNGLVHLNRSAFYVPEVQYAQERAINVIESKRKCRVGEVIFGASEALPEKRYLSHKIQNSFDSNGYLIIDDDLLDVVDTKPEVVKSDNIENQRDSLTKLDKTKFSDEIDNKPTIFKSEVEKLPEVNLKPETKVKSDAVNVISIFSIKPPQFETKPSKTLPAAAEKPFSTPFPVKTDAPPIFSFASKPDVPKMNFNKSESQKDSNIFKPNIFSQNFPLKANESGKTGSSSLFSNTSSKISNIQESTTAIKSSTFKFAVPKQIEALPVSLTVTKGNTAILAEVPITKSNKIDLEHKYKHSPLEDAETAEKLRKSEAEALKIKKAEVERQLAEKQRKIEEEKRRLEQIKAKQIQNDVQSVVSSLLAAVDSKIRQEALSNLKTRIWRRLTLKFLQKWRQNARKSTRKRKALDCGPLWAVDRDLHDVASGLSAESQNITLRYRKRYRTGNPLELNPKLDESIPKFDSDIVFRILRDLATPTPSAHFRISESIYWKVSISLPDSQEMRVGLDRLSHFLNQYFWYENGQYLIKQSIGQLPVHSICIAKSGSTGSAPEIDANALIFIGDEFNAKFQMRMAAILKTYGLLTRLPVVLILQDAQSVPEAEDKLRALQQRHIVSNYVIISDNFSYSNLVAIFADAIRFLAGWHTGAPPLHLDMLRDGLLRHLCTELWRRAHSYAKWNDNYEKCLKSPNVVIELYNETLNRLTAVYVNEAVKEYARFPVEFRKHPEISGETGNCAFSIDELTFPCNYQYFPDFLYTCQFDSYLAHVKRILTSLQFPPLPARWPPANQIDLEAAILEYCQNIFENPEKPFLKTMARILQQFDPLNDFSGIAHVNWTSVIEVMSIERVNALDLRMPIEFSRENSNIFKELFVVYEKSALNDFLRSDWMYVGNAAVQRHLSSILRTEEGCAVKDPERFRKQKVDFGLEIDVAAEIEKARQKLESWRGEVEKVRAEVGEFNSLWADLKDSLNVDRRISKTIEKRLEAALKD